MYTFGDLSKEIADEIERLRAADEAVLHPDWIAQAVLKMHPDVHGRDKEFFLYNAQQNLRAEVRRQLNRYKLKPEAEADRQLILPGFNRLQQYYLVDRDHVQCAVHVDRLAHKEVLAKAAELRAMAEGCLDHVRELLRYWETKHNLAA